MNKERSGSLIFLLAGVYGLIFATQLPVGRWNEPGPGVFPLCLSILLSISGILGLIYGKEKRPAIDWRETARKLAAPFLIVVLTGAFILALEAIGYLVASLTYLLLLFLCVSRYKLWIAVGLSILLGMGSWYFFTRLLAVQLPRGFLAL